NRPNRFASHAIENKGVPGLSYLCYRFDLPAVYLDVAEHRRGRQIIIPDAVVHRLIVPDSLARFGFKTEKALGVEVVSQPVSTVPVIGWRAERNIDITQVFVRAHQRPVVGIAGV